MDRPRNSPILKSFGAFVLAVCGAIATGNAGAATTRLDADAGHAAADSRWSGPDPALAAQWEGRKPQAAVDALVDAAARPSMSVDPAANLGFETLPAPRRGEERTPEERRQLLRQTAVRGLELQGWWMSEMLTTPAPLTERMTLFWHGHFTSGLREVRSPQLMYRQNVTLRQHALGNYRELLTAVVHDPAMLLYLNNQQNRRDAPNENFARELLELFTLGEGHYTEQDVREAARAFTGWRMLPPDGRFTVVARQHDDGEKLFLGARGRFDGDDIVAQILKQPRAAEFIVEKLWREFVLARSRRARGEVARRRTSVAAGRSRRW